MSGPMLANKSVLTLDGARTLLNAAESKARDLKLANVAIVIVDTGGYLLCGLRMDASLPSSSDIAIAKARAAALLGKPTKFWREMLNGGNLWPLGMPNVVAAEGGLPLIIKGEVLGGIGVAGASGQEDREICDAAVLALTS